MRLFLLGRLERVNIMSILRRILFTGIGLLFYINVFGADVPAKSEGELLFYFDTASFRAKENKTLQEFYYQIPLTEVSFQKKNGFWSDTLQVAFEILNSDGKNLLRDQWILPIQAKDQNAIEGRFFPDYFDLTINPGSYQAILRIAERTSGKNGTAAIPLQVKSFQTNDLILSEIQFSSYIEQTDSSNGKMVKNSLLVQPNPNRVYGKTLLLLYFYIEYYNMSPAAEIGTYDVEYSILDLDSGVVKQLPKKTKSKTNTFGLEASAINVASLKNSGYFLKISIKDNDTGDMTQTIRGFWNITPERMNLSKSPKVENNVYQTLSKMTDAEIDVHFRQLKYIMVPDQIKLYQSLPPNARMRFLINFWVSLDQNPKTDENEFWDEFQKRVAYANERYSGGFREGWLTDCGRIIIKYGIPNEIQKETMRTQGKPYEEWFYNIEGGMRFIFLQEEGFGHLRLIYSSDAREFTDPNWELLLNQG